MPTTPTTPTTRPTVPAAEEILGKYFPVVNHGFVALVDYMARGRRVLRSVREDRSDSTRLRARPLAGQDGRVLRGPGRGRRAQEGGLTVRVTDVQAKMRAAAIAVVEREQLPKVEVSATGSCLMSVTISIPANLGRLTAPEVDDLRDKIGRALLEVLESEVRADASAHQGDDDH